MWQTGFEKFSLPIFFYLQTPFFGGATYAKTPVAHI